jgi:hypothetical protein
MVNVILNRRDGKAFERAIDGSAYKATAGRYHSNGSFFEIAASGVKYNFRIASRSMS